jgi:hypothetical protein
MSSTDILQDVHDREQMPKVNKIRLFLVHIIGVVSVGYLGKMIIILLSMETFASLDQQLEDIKDGTGELPSLEEINFWNAAIIITGFVFVFMGGIISYLICRKKKLPVIIPVSIFLYSIIIFWMLDQTPYSGYLFPGGYLLYYFGWNIGPFVNIVYIAVIIYIFFFSKRVKNWWLRPVIE